MMVRTENIDETDRSGYPGYILTDTPKNMDSFKMETNQRLEYITSTLVRFRLFWIVPAVAGFVLALVYVMVFRGETWTARQSLIVRDDLLGQSFKPGHFNSLESMKSAQETILEISRKPQVIRNVLKQLGPASKGLLFNRDAYPDDATIEDVQGMISFSAPNGAEFGKTEVVILNAKASSPERSHKFIELLLNEMDQNISDVRSQRLQSMESELAMVRDGAALSLEQSMKKLREMDHQLGADVGTMNGMNSSQSGDGSAKMEISQIHIEKRSAQVQLDSAFTAQRLLTDAKSNPERMLATSAEFLKSQPKLEALSKSLVDAQKAFADNSGRYQPQHPLVQRSVETIAVMQQQIYLELENLTASVESSIRELKQRITRLDEQADAQRDRLVELGTKRVDHLTINSEVTKKTEIYNLAESRLSEVQALSLAKGRIEWLTRIGEPQISTRPDGMGKKATVLAGGLCGLMLGLGLVMLIAPPADAMTSKIPNRRFDDMTARERNARIPSPSPTAAENRAAIRLDEVVGPTAATAIQTATNATTKTVNKGFSAAKTALEKSSIGNTTLGKMATNFVTKPASQSIVIPDVSQPESKSESDTESGSGSDSIQMVPPTADISSVNESTPVPTATSFPVPVEPKSSLKLDAETISEIERYENDPKISASDVLAELRANRAKQTAPKVNQKIKDPLSAQLSDLPAESTRSTNQRPFDLAKSAESKSLDGTQPIPDQLKSLADSIASFAIPPNKS